MEISSCRMFSEKINLQSISFDESDRNLFQVDDPRLRADALKHSILPRLHALLNKCIATVRDVYAVEVLDDSRVSSYPQFRTKRENDLQHLYDAAYVGLGGQQLKDKWNGVQRKDGKPVQLLPFRYGFQLTEEGLCLFLENNWLKGLTDQSHKQFFDFHLKFESLIHVLCYNSKVSPYLAYGGETKPISTFKQHYDYMLKNRIFDNHFVSEFKLYPVLPDLLQDCIRQFTCFYAVYDSYLQIAMGDMVRFEDLLQNLNEWIKRRDDSDDWLETDDAENEPSEEAKMQAREAAERKVKVMPSIRWQVFQRDNWRCVACGRGALDGVILHIDHITPRSKGGRDTLDNYQTLCHVCNLGKSNRDSTSLRQVC